MENLNFNTFTINKSHLQLCLYVFFSPHKKPLTVSPSLIIYMLERLLQGGFCLVYFNLLLVFRLNLLKHKSIIVVARSYQHDSLFE